MIDFATPVRKNRVLDPHNSDEFIRIDSVFSSNDGDSRSDFPDVARRIISSRPAVCVALAFVVGGIVGWLTSRR